MKNRTKSITQAAIIAALYVILTALSALFGLDKGAVQLRLSEMLTVLPVVTPSAIPGVAIGCLLSGILFGGNPIDIIFGSLTTLIAAVITYYIGRKHRLLAPVPPIAGNAIAIPFILKYAYGLEGGLPYFALTVFIGEFICCGILGLILLRALPKRLIDLMK